MFTIAIVGRPNVGKSTIFNSLAKGKKAITLDLPGVTRDRKESTANLYDLEFKLIDTAGYEITADKVNDKTIIAQINFAMDEADLIYLVIDAKDGLTRLDYDFINIVRKKNKNVILLINKSEVKKRNLSLDDIYKIGFKNYIFLSSEHRIGYDELYKITLDYYKTYQNIYPEILVSEGDNAIRVAIVGKPNVGKSTLINNLLNSNRLLVRDEIGTTRDAIEVPFRYMEQDYVLIDTAGIRKRAKINNKIDLLSYEDSFKAVRFADICILLIDASQGVLEKQDLYIASHIIEEGRGLLIILNKTDLLDVAELAKIKDEVSYQINKYAPQNKALKIISISAKYRKNFNFMLEIIPLIYKNWNFHIKTPQLNKWLKEKVIEHRPPLYKGKEIRLKFISQIKTRPPTFVIICNYPEQISDSYIRYLKNSLTTSFSLYGVNPRFLFKKPSNPYSKSEERKTIKK
jgi:GTP-binding protein